MIAKIDELNYDIIKEQIIELSKLTIMDKFDIVSKIKKIVPEFLSNNSDYEELDRSLVEDTHKKSIPHS